MIDKTINQVFNLNNEVNQNQNNLHFLQGHTEHYISAYKMFLDNKILVLVLKILEIFVVKKNIIVMKLALNPHNTYIQILSETGILGFLFLIFSFMYFCKNVFLQLYYKIKGKIFFSDFEICILSGILIYLWPIAPSGNIFNNWLTIIMILNFPLLIWSRKK